VLSGKAVKNYLKTIISDLDSGKPPTRSAPKWVRSVAVPAAVGLTLGMGGLAGCMTDGTDGGGVDRSMAADAKADGWTDHLCDMIGAPSDCDICDELDWYGDGEYCDDFCDLPDPDCATTCDTDADCAETEQCNAPDIGTCPEGAYCILPPSPGGTCEPALGQCSDGSDNDSDGAVDCIDSDCAMDPSCIMTPMYGVPFEGACDDGVDNDGDGTTDCADFDCFSDPSCGATPEYAVPFEDCSDGTDNDGDGDVDGDDADCTLDPGCIMTPMYAAAFERCSDGADNDYDGLVDCADPDCFSDADCAATPEYAVPFESDCDDGADNDFDGDVDCDDADCELDPNCTFAPLYAAPIA